MDNSPAKIKTEKTINRPSNAILLLCALLSIALITIFYLLYSYIQLKHKASFLNINNINAPPENITVVPTQGVSIVPTKEIDISTWLTLKNSSGFTVKYPNTYEAIGDGYDTDPKKSSTVYITSKSDQLSPAVHINVEELKGPFYKDKSLSEISKGNYDANLANKNTFKEVVSPYKETTFDGVPAYTYTILSDGYSGLNLGFMFCPENMENYDSNVYCKMTIVETIKNGKYFLIVYSSDDQTIRQIVDTVKLQ